MIEAELAAAMRHPGGDIAAVMFWPQGGFD